MNCLALIALSMIEVIAIAAFGYATGYIFGFLKRSSSRLARFKTAVIVSAFAGGMTGLLPFLLVFQCESPGVFREILLTSWMAFLSIFVSFGIPFQAGSVSPSRAAPPLDEESAS